MPFNLRCQRPSIKQIPSKQYFNFRCSGCAFARYGKLFHALWVYPEFDAETANFQGTQYVDKIKNYCWKYWCFMSVTFWLGPSHLHPVLPHQACEVGLTGLYNLIILPSPLDEVTGTEAWRFGAQIAYRNEMK